MVILNTNHGHKKETDYLHQLLNICELIFIGNLSFYIEQNIFYTEQLLFISSKAYRANIFCIEHLNFTVFLRLIFLALRRKSDLRNFNLYFKIDTFWYRFASLFATISFLINSDPKIPKPKFWACFFVKFSSLGFFLFFWFLNGLNIQCKSCE